jgi:flagellar biosynthesis protein FlhG
MDQASSLREYMHRFNQEKQKSARVITITSGKGGVGKSNFTLNFALGLKEMGKKVVVLDLDLSTANINILMGISARFSLQDVLHQRKHLKEIIEVGTEGIEYINGGLEIDDLLKFDQQKMSFFWNQIQELQAYADFILLDTGAGISKELVDFIVASDETILVTTSEPTAMADSYAVLKTVQRNSVEMPKFRLVVNRVQSYREGVETSKALQFACQSFLKVNLKTLGYLFEDAHVRQSVKIQTPFLISYPHCQASKGIKQIVYTYLPEIKKSSTMPTAGIRGFFEKILALGKS